jgi:nuclear GTP-binding protein
LAYLRHEAPTLPFRASTQSQRTNLSTRTAPAVLHLLKSFRKGPAGSITVGVVGAPNVGKSSLINSLKRARVCATAAEPGCTTDLQTVALERGVKIVDSPGVVFDDRDTVAAVEGALLRNVLSVDDIADPIAVVGTILARTDAGTIQKLYKLPPFATSLEFLTMLALTTGRLGPGGTPDTEAAARVVLRDWNRSKIPFFTEVPQRHASDVAEGTQIVEAFAPAFDLGALYGANDAAAFGEMEIEEAGGDEMQEDAAMVPNSDPSSDAMRDDDDQIPISAFAALPSSASRKRKRSASPDAEVDAFPFANASFHSEDSPMSETHHLAPPSTTADSERPAKRQRLEKIKKPRNQAPPPTTGLALASPSAVRAAEGENPLGRKALRLAKKRAARAARKGADMTVDDDEGVSTSVTGTVGFAFSVSVPFGGLGEVTI